MTLIEEGAGIAVPCSGEMGDEVEVERKALMSVLLLPEAGALPKEFSALPETEKEELMVLG